MSNPANNAALLNLRWISDPLLGSSIDDYSLVLLVQHGLTEITVSARIYNTRRREHQLVQRSAAH
jgi:hypothetical protein